MDLIEKFASTVTTKSKEATDKAKEIAEIANLKKQVSVCEEVIRKNYIEIGRLYFEKFGEQPDELFEKQCRNIKNAKNGVDNINQKINDIKGV